MEVIILGTLIGYGIYLSSEENSNIKNLNSSNNNIYESNRSINIRREEKIKSDKLYKKIKNVNSNIIIPGPPNVKINKIDYMNDELPITYSEIKDNNLNELENEEIINRQELINIESSNIESGGWGNITMSGNKLNNDKYVHNNMVPFFGGSVKQNVDDYATKGIFETFTGTHENYQMKKEISPLFEPEANITNPYGTGNLNNNIDRYNISKKRNNVTPIERINVGPGLNQGYVSKPNGGFQQSDTRDYVIPKTTNQLRTVNNPKMSYKGVIIAGSKIGRTGKIGEVNKKLPNTFYENSPDRYFTTTGAVIAPKQNAKILLKHNSRNDTGKRLVMGGAGPITGSKEKLRSNVKISTKQQLKGPNLGIVNSEGSWNIFNKLADYGKKAFNIIPTKRNSIEDKTVLNPAKGNIMGTKRVNQDLKHTIKEYTINNKQWASNIQNTNMKHIIYNPKDSPKPTIKETTIYNKRNGNILSQKPNNSKIYNPNDIAKPTIKQTTINNQRIMGNVNTLNNKAHKVISNNDIPATTIKQTTINNKRIMGNINSLNKAYKVKSPDDIARTTIKETVMMRNTTGNKNNQKSGEGYKIRKYDFDTTNRDETQGEYINNPQGNEHGGYKVAKVIMQNTNKQFLSDYEYKGIVGNGSDSKPTNYDTAYNANIKTNKENIELGRTPTIQGPKTNTTKNMINVKTSKIADIQNSYIQERGNNISKISNIIPTKNSCEFTKDKNIPNPVNERFDTSLVDAYIKNPYTQSLNSYL